MSSKWDEYFKDRKWRVAEEVSGAVVQDGIEVVFDRGRFTVADGGAFQSPLSTNKGRIGVLLQETDLSGATDIPGSRACFGDAAVKKARKDYRAIW